MAGERGNWVWETDVNGFYTYSSSQIGDVLGYQPKEIIGKAIWDFLPHKKAKRVSEKLKAIIKSQRPIVVQENENLNKDGQLVLLETIAIPLFGTNGQFRGYRGIHKYVTDDAENGEALVKSEQKYCAPFHDMLNAVMYAKILTNEENQPVDIVILDINDTYERLTKRKRENVVGIPVTKAIPNKKGTKSNLVSLYGASLVDVYTRVALTGETAKYDFFFEPFGRWYSAVIYSPSKGYFVEVFDDITERKQMEEELRENQEFSLSILSNSTNPVLVINPDTSIRYVNPAFERLTGIHSSGLIGNTAPYPWFKKRAGYKDSEAYLHKALGGPSSVERSFTKKNGELFWVEATLITVKKDQKPKYHIANWVDITQQRELRDDLQFYATKLIKTQEEERKRIARELHDETIQSLASLLTRLDDITMTNEGLPDLVVSQLQNLRSGIDSILDEVRFSHQLRPGMLDVFGLTASLESLVEEARIEGTPKYRLEFFGCQRRLSPEIELVMYRIAQEAINNIKKHSKATKAVVTIKYTKRKVKLIINDNGIGFKLPRSVSSFARKGRLGLIGMKERIRLVNGSLSIRSMVGKGTTIEAEISA